MEEQSQRGKGRIIEIDHYNLVSDWYFRISYGRYSKKEMNCPQNEQTKQFTRFEGVFLFLLGGCFLGCLRPSPQRKRPDLTA